MVIVGLGLLALMVSYPWSGKFVAGLCAVILTLAIFAVVSSDVFAITPAIKGGQGAALENSVATLEKVRLGGTDQWVTIRGRNKNNPLLLFLAGGPGGSELAWTRRYLTGLEDHFVVVNWDQPGAGKSYGAVDPQELTVDRYLSDAAELVKQLRQRSGQPKIYLLGESWGSYLGIRLVQAYPHLFYAYAGSGQMVNFTENDRMGYELALSLVEQRGDRRTLTTLTENGPPPYTGSSSFLKYAAYLNVLNGYMYDNAAGEGGPGNSLLDVVGAPEYSLVDKLNWGRGLIEVFNAFYPDLDGRDLMVEAPRLEVPVYFLVGRHDVNAMASLVDEYYQALEAPAKTLIWFENSGHTPLYEESQRFIQVMVEQVLRETYPDQ
jgi:pimeloyl-ACP methyl ester carboxylesterase